MTVKKHSRLLTPAIAVLAGTTIAVAVGIRQGWQYALVSEAVALAWAVSLYVIGGKDTDIGAVVGAQQDERQELVKLRAARLCLVVVVVAVVAGCLIAAATKNPIWPFQVVAVLIGIAYFYGLWLYGTDHDEADAAVGEHGNHRDGF
jgi:glucan phosphoethanolaminetransferase (alkaline phosphatase superfamily)